MNLEELDRMKMAIDSLKIATDSMEIQMTDFRCYLERLDSQIGKMSVIFLKELDKRDEQIKELSNWKDSCIYYINKMSSI